MRKLLLFAMFMATCAWAQAVSVTFRVDMSQVSVSANGVHLAGSFQGWSPGNTAMTSQGNGIYSVTLDIAAGSYQYKFINGNSWGNDEAVPAGCGVSNGVGGFNRSLTVADTDIELPIVCFGQCAACTSPISVTFRVNMSEQTVSSNGVHIAGSFQGWNAGNTAMNDEGNGIYSYTASLTAGVSYQYKFINGNAFTNAESIPMTCGVNDGFGGYNRTITLSEDSVLLAVCFGACEACAPVAPPVLVNITFEVNMSNESVSADGVHVAGTFNDWNPSANELLDTDGDGIYSATIAVDTMQQIQFKFLNGNAWGTEESVPADCGLTNDLNRFLEVTDADDTYGPVCFSECVNCEDVVETPSNQITLLVNMTNQTVAPEGVYVVGNFQGFVAGTSAMTDLGNGVWSYTYTADEWANISFKFLNGNTYAGVENVPSGCGLPDGVGGFNRILETGSNDVTFGPFCFGTCDVCPAIEPTPNVAVTFNVNMTQQTISAEGVHVAGNFQGWDPNATSLADEDGDGIYSITVEVPQGDTIEYKFINGADWPFVETVPEDCGTDNGIGGFNRFAIIAAEVVLPTVCFGECQDCQPIVTPDSTLVTFHVNMQNQIVSVDGVHLAGNFQGWNPGSLEMTDADGDNIYSVSALIPSGMEIAYKFINGNAWTTSESVPAECGFDDGSGNINRNFTVPAEDIILDPVCFGGCENCAPIVDPQTVAAALRVNMTGFTYTEGQVFVQINGGEALQMTAVGNGVFEYSAQFDANSTLNFTFWNGTTQEVVPAACAVNGTRTLELLEENAVFGPVCFGGCENCIVVEPTTANVTFLVNMEGLTVSPNGVHVAGSFQGWSPSTTAMTDSNGDGIYEYTASVALGTSFQFKFINGNAWAGSEAVPAACGVADGFNGFNRFVTAISADTTYGPVCFSACVDCGIVVEPTLVDVTFKVNMLNETVSPNGVHIAGNFQGWDPGASEMTDTDGDGIYEFTAQIESGTTVLFKFINDNDWPGQESVPGDCGAADGFGGFNRSLELTTNDEVYGPVCFGECENCSSTVPVLVNFQVDMTNETVSPAGVFVVGSFNDWDLATATPLANGGNGIYAGVVVSTEGEELSYKFVNGDAWTGAETVPSECGADDGSGNINRAYTVTADAFQTVPVVCFSTCSACVFQPIVNVTFRVDLGTLTASPSGVHVTGSFNNFAPNATPMTNAGGNVYTATVQVDPNQIMQYKFINGNAWGEDETVPFECGVDNGVGGFNRSINIGEVSVNLPEVCFSDCQDCAVNVNNMSDDEFKIYPNPAIENVIFEMGESGISSLRIIDMQGKLVQTVPVYGRYKVVVDVANLAGGLYNVVTDTGISKGLFAVQR